MSRKVIRATSVLVLISLSACLIGVSHAGPTENAILAAMKLSELPNYSWISEVSDDARDYAIEGKTDQSGYTWLRLPMVKSIADRLGPAAECDIEAVFRGENRCVIQTEGGWLRPDELDQFRERVEDEAWARAMKRGTPLPQPPDGPPAISFLSLELQPDRDEPPYSNAQFAMSRPQDDLGIIVSSFSDLKATESEATGTLTEIGARLLLVRGGLEAIHPLATRGSFRLEFKNGMVVKYILELEGLVQVERKKILVHQTSSTSISDVGTTKLDLPDVVRAKLGG
jgi:hypothetical protein